MLQRCCRTDVVIGVLVVFGIIQLLAFIAASGPLLVSDADDDVWDGQASESEYVLSHARP